MRFKKVLHRKRPNRRNLAPQGDNRPNRRSKATSSKKMINRFITISTKHTGLIPLSMFLFLRASIEANLLTPNLHMKTLHL
ncbi:hypothetical protein HanPI659440_Chr15g0608901 [Helianthus annuus]|nr:hypothetical protein HanPI659440_Chr15g0608901 [Helianthus annuus]